MFKKINNRLAEIEDVLIRDGKHLGSEIDGKVERSEFDDFKKNVIGDKKTDFTGGWLISWTDMYSGKGNTIKEKTLFEEIDEIKESIKKIEEYLGIERVKQETKTDKYTKKVTKKK